MKKLVLGFLMIGSIVMVPIKSYGATNNNVTYINEGKVDKVITGQINIDNSYYDLKPGSFFKLELINAEFDLDENDKAFVRSNYLEFSVDRKTSIIAMVKDNVAEGGNISILFSTKLLGGEAKLVIDSYDSGISPGTYVYAIAGDVTTYYEGKVEKLEPVFLEVESILPPIVIKETVNAAFRTAQTYNKDKDLLKLEIVDPQFQFRNATPRDWIQFVVEDDEGNSVRYREGQEAEVHFDQGRNIITFKQEDNEIFNLKGRNYKVTIENLKIRSMDSEQLKSDVEIKISGSLVEDQKLKVAYQKAQEPVKPEVKEPEIKEPEVQEPEIPVVPEPTPINKVKVEFTEGSQTYKLDGTPYPIDAKAYVSKHNRIMVPVRYLSQALGAEDADVSWNGTTGIVTIKGDNNVTIDTRKKQVTSNYNVTTLSDIQIIKGRTFVPVGEIGKALDMKVYWDKEKRTAIFN